MSNIWDRIQARGQREKKKYVDPQRPASVGCSWHKKESPPTERNQHSKSLDRKQYSPHRNTMKPISREQNDSLLDPQAFVREMLREKRDEMVVQHQKQLQEVEQLWKTRLANLQNARDQDIMRIKSEFGKEWKTYHQMEQAICKNQHISPGHTTQNAGTKHFNPRCSSTVSTVSPYIRPERSRRNQSTNSKNPKTESNVSEAHQPLVLQDLLPMKKEKSSKIKPPLAPRSNALPSIPETAMHPNAESTQSSAFDQSSWIFPSVKLMTWNWLESVERVGSAFKCPIEHCTRKYATKYILRDHLRTIHSSDSSIVSTFRREQRIHAPMRVKKEYECPMTGCGRVYTGMGYLTKHIQRVHPDVNLFKCAKCGKRFKFQYQLKAHWKRDHDFGKDKAFLCRLCRKGFTRQQDMIWHLNRGDCIRERKKRILPGKPMKSLHNSSPSLADVDD